MASCVDSDRYSTCTAVSAVVTELCRDGSEAARARLVSKWVDLAKKHIYNNKKTYPGRAVRLRGVPDRDNCDCVASRLQCGFRTRCLRPEDLRALAVIRNAHRSAALLDLR